MLHVDDEVPNKVVLLKEPEIIRRKMFVLLLQKLASKSEVWVQTQIYKCSHVSAATNKLCRPHTTRRMIGVITGMQAKMKQRS